MKFGPMTWGSLQARGAVRHHACTALAEAGGIGGEQGIIALLRPRKRKGHQTPLGLVPSWYIEKLRPRCLFAEKRNAVDATRDRP